MEAVRARRFTFLITALTLAGCVSAADGPSPTDPLSVTTTTIIPTTTTTVTLEEGLANYQSCLSDLGVDIGDIELDGLGRPLLARAMADLDFGDREILEALDSCGPELSTGALDLGPDPELRDLVLSSLEEFAECLRRQGVVGFPNPRVGFNGLGAPFPVDEIPWTDADLPDAVTVCSARLAASSP